jgi:hypothetical protein
MNYSIQGNYNGYTCASANNAIIAPVSDCSTFALDPSFRNCTVHTVNTDARLQSSTKSDCAVADSAPAAFRKISPGNDVITIK